MNQKNLELEAIKALGYASINREDLARSKALSEMKQSDDENCLTVLTETFVSIVS